MSQYSTDFYDQRDRATRHAAETILSEVLGLFPNISSAVDIGCGVGTWLSVLRDHGVGTILGVDGPWVDPKHLVISPECFTPLNLNEPINLGRRYDLAICLEVAEHVSEQQADRFVSSLCNLSDIVLFSAAIPEQGGIDHVNEQWPEYWENLFKTRGYAAVDCIRRAVWSDNEIPIWYRQNVILYVRSNVFDELIRRGVAPRSAPLSVVHPEFYLARTNLSLRQAVRVLWGSLARAIKRRIFKK